MKVDAVPAGYQDIYKGTGDEDFENPEIINLTGSGVPTVKKTGERTVELCVPAGHVGDNTSFGVKVDGHIGDGDVPIVSLFDYDTVSADATEINFLKVRREKIPT